MRYYKGEQAVILSIRAVLFKRCSDGACLPIGAGRDAQIAFEDAREVALVGKATLSGNARQGQRGLGQQPLRALDSLAQHKVVRRFSRRTLEQSGKVKGAEADMLRQYLQGELLTQV